MKKKTEFFKTSGNMSGIYPSGDRVLIKPDAVEEYTEGGIYIPDEVKDKVQMAAHYGHVVAMGPDSFLHTLEVREKLVGGAWKITERRRTGYSEPFAKTGDRVAFGQYAGKTMTGIDGEDYKIMNDEDIMCTCEEGVTQTTLEARKPLGEQG